MLRKQRLQNLPRFLFILGGASALFAFGCAPAEDGEIETKIHSVEDHRSSHPHYPITTFGDFGKDNGPAGVAVDAYGFYVHSTTKPDPLINVMSRSAAIQRLAKTFQLAIESVRSAEAKTPPPNPPYPTSPDWKATPHPKLGTYTLVSQVGSKPLTFDVTVPKGDTKLPEPVTIELGKDAVTVIDQGLKHQTDDLKASKTPPAFSLCTQELLNVQQGSRGVEPHLLGNPLLLVPLDRSLALKGLENSILRLLTSTSKLKDGSANAHLVIKAPGIDATLPIPLARGNAQDQTIAKILNMVGAKIDALNKSAV